MSDRAFLGVLAHLDPRAPGQTMLVTVALPRGECDAVVKALGAPDPELGPHVALLPCLRPDHPRSDDDAVLLAALRTVNRLLAAGPPRLSHELLDELGAQSADARRAAAGHHGTAGLDPGSALMADVSPTAELLDRIAATLGVPVETFTARPAPTASINPVVDQVAALLVDPDGWRLAVAFEALSTQFRRSLADIAEAILVSSSRSEAA